MNIKLKRNISKEELSVSAVFFYYFNKVNCYEKLLDDKCVSRGKYSQTLLIDIEIETVP